MTQDQKDRIIKKLIREHITISTMESCTSGLIASMITDTEGASAVFPGGYVTYLNETKVFVGVDENVIKKYGVYSGECAVEMAQTVRKNMKTDIGIGITGTTGNLDPNNEDSVQGQVFFSIIIRDQVYVFEHREDVTGLERHRIKQIYADLVFDKLAQLLL